MRGFTKISLLAILPVTLGQFAPASSSRSASLGAAPTESVGCRIVNGAWVCSAPRASATPAPSATSAAVATSLSSGIPPPPSESVGCSLHGDHYHCEGPASGYTPTPVQSVLAPPTESVGCSLHGDHYHCEGPAPGYTPTATANQASVPSPTESSNCMWHETHWDCFDTAQELQEAQSATEGSGECIIHVGHTHGDCSASDLACGKILLENYNMPLHIGSIFIVLVSSGLGVLIPLISGWFRKTRDSDSDAPLTTDRNTSADFGRGKGLWTNVFFVARHFGTGIIISTAFIHLLFHGFVMFQNECVGHLSYESTAPAIAMASALITFMFDFIGSRIAHKTSVPESPSSENGSHDHEKNTRFSNAMMDDGHGHHVDAAFAAEQNWQVMLLEAGIIFHSIMIGVTLGAGSGAGWVTLLIVIVFHQFFEGLALGARIAILTWISRLRALIMGGAFTLITPIGIVIGIAVRKSFSQNGKASLLSVGILNSISAGILLYTAFKLLSSDFTEGPLRDAKAGKVIVAFAALVAGLIAMSVLGKWA